MRDDWKRLESWFSAHWPEIIPDLNPGCSPSALEKLEREIGVVLPDSFKEFYLIHNGQRAVNYMGMFYGASLLPLAKILEAWTVWAGIIDEYGKEQMEDLFDQYQTSLVPSR